MTDSLTSGDDQILDTNALTALIEEAKKDPEAFAKRKYDSDQYIRVMERRSDELRDYATRLQEEVNTRPRLEEYLKTLQTNITSNNTTPQVSDDKPSITPEDVKSLVAAQVQQMTETQRKESNYRTVEQQMKQIYGESYKSVIKNKMESLGLNEQWTNDLARTQPNAFMQMFGQQPMRETFQAPPSTQQRAMASSGQQKRDFAYYEKMKVEDPKTYYSAKTTQQMINDYAELGDAFETGSFKSEVKF